MQKNGPASFVRQQGQETIPVNFQDPCLLVRLRIELFRGNNPRRNIRKTGRLRRYKRRVYRKYRQVKLLARWQVLVDMAQEPHLIRPGWLSRFAVPPPAEEGYKADPVPQLEPRQ